MTERRYVLALAALGTLAAGGSNAQPSRAAAPVALGTVGELAARVGEGTQLAVVAGYHAPGDGGGGLFLWQAQSQQHADGGLVIGRDGQVGRWMRLFDGPIDIRMFGAKGDGKADCTDAIQAAIDAARGAEVRIPAGRWLISRTLRFKSAAGRHSAGLKLLGEGPFVSIIDSRVLEGPAIAIEQAEGYKFGTHGILRDLDLVGEFAKPGREQHGIVMSGAWQYRFDRLVVRQFRGDGLHVPFVPDRGGRFSEVEVVAGSDVVRRAKGHFSDSLNHREIIEGPGIAPDTYVDALLDDKTVRMTKPALATGRVELNIWGRNADGQTSLLGAQDCRFIWNGGWGIYSNAVIGLSLTLRDTQIGNNQGGGIRTGGYLDMTGGTCTDNGNDQGKGHGLLLEAPARGNVVDLVRIEGVEIDGNHETNLWLRRVRFARITRNRFNAAEHRLGRQFPPVGIRLGDSDGSSADTVEFSQNQIRVGGLKNWPHVGFEIPDGASVENIVARDTMFWGGWSDAHHTRYRIGRLANPEARVLFEDAGVPAPGRSVPAAYIVQLRADGAAQPLAGGAATILPLVVSFASTPKLVRGAPVSRLAAVSFAAASVDASLPEAPATAPAPGTSLLVLDKEMARFARVVRTAGQTLTLDRPAEQAWNGPGFLGGLAVPFEAFYSVDVSVDVVSPEPMSVTLGLLVDGKPVHFDNAAAVGLPRPQTIRFTTIGRWAAGSVLHALARNEAKGELSLRGATMTVRLLT